MKTKWYQIKVILTREYMKDHEGEILLWDNIWKYRYGLAYRDWALNASVYYLIPINLIVAIVRFLFFQILWKFPNKLNQKEKSGYLRGYVKGWNDAQRINLYKSRKDKDKKEING